MEALDEPAEDEHPVLIKQSFEGPSGPEVDAVYGTSADVDGPEFFLIPKVARKACGLWKPTYLDVSRIMRLPWCEEYFPPKGHASPPKRHMPENAIMEFQIHAAYFQNR